MRNTNSNVFLVILLGVLSAFGPFVVDLYLPSLPQLAQFFATTPSMTQLTLTTAMIGLAVGQLLLGPMSDKFGRKKPLILSLVIYIISTVCIIFSPNVETMIVLRVVQGLSSAGSVVISRAVATDLYRGREMTRFFGLLMTINGIAPIISPILGSLLLEYVSWKGVFVFLALIGLVVLVFCFRLKESLMPENRLSGSILSTFSTFGIIVKNRLFMSYVGIESFLLGAMFGLYRCVTFYSSKFLWIKRFCFQFMFWCQRGRTGDWFKYRWKIAKSHRTFSWRTWLFCCRALHHCSITDSTLLVLRRNRFLLNVAHDGINVPGNFFVSHGK